MQTTPCHRRAFVAFLPRVKPVRTAGRSALTLTPIMYFIRLSMAVGKGTKMEAGNLIPMLHEAALTPASYQALADVPPEIEWLANIPNAKPGASINAMSRSSPPSPDCARQPRCAR